jgi:hypothetical protein
MAGPFNVRIFGYKGMIQVQQLMLKQYSADAVFLLDEPYQWSQLLAVPGGGAAVSSIGAGRCRTIRRYCGSRFRTPSKSAMRSIRTAQCWSLGAHRRQHLAPALRLRSVLEWGKGYTISMCDAASFL